MGVTAMSIIYSPWGQRSGAHLNLALTATCLRLGKVAPYRIRVNRISPGTIRTPIWRRIARLGTR